MTDPAKVSNKSYIVAKLVISCFSLVSSKIVDIAELRHLGLLSKNIGKTPKKKKKKEREKFDMYCLKTHSFGWSNENSQYLLYPWYTKYIGGI